MRGGAVKNDENRLTGNYFIINSKDTCSLTYTRAHVSLKRRVRRKMNIKRKKERKKQTSFSTISGLINGGTFTVELGGRCLLVERAKQPPLLLV